jgi:catechol 2,3-dioxygenase-like lactoylglutathione lyase family enzyme
MAKQICGIQQMGVGVSNVHEAWKWYRENFGMDIRVFDEAAEAALMIPYTGGKARSRHAILAANLQGGGGFEIWQYTSRVPEPPKFEVKFGDLGIYICKIKCKDVKETYRIFKEKNLDVLGDVSKDPAGNDHFYVRDPYNNIFELVKSDVWFKDENKPTGSVYGAVINVSNLDKAIEFYKASVGYDTVQYKEEGIFDDFKALPGGDIKCKRALLTQSNRSDSSFSALFGPGQIELVEAQDKEHRKIFEGRYWGDLGFIHLCFDIRGMEDLKKDCESAGFPFTVDSANSFDMGEAAGHFSYIEDPDGALIEFVETHKVPILKKLGWYVKLKDDKPVPNWMIKAMKFNRYKGK